jgi:hypothetical protein
LKWVDVGSVSVRVLIVFVSRVPAAGIALFGCSVCGRTRERQRAPCGLHTVASWGFPMFHHDREAIALPGRSRSQFPFAKCERKVRLA